MTQVPVAIVGVGALFPGSPDGAGFWRYIVASRDLISDVPPGHWLIEDYYDSDPTALDKTYSKRGAFLGQALGRHRAGGGARAGIGHLAQPARRRQVGRCGVHHHALGRHAAGQRHPEAAAQEADEAFDLALGQRWLGLSLQSFASDNWFPCRLIRTCYRCRGVTQGRA